MVSSLPHSTKFQLHIYSYLSEQEKDSISQRSKSGLLSLKYRGVKLGTPQWNLDRLVKAKKEKNRQNYQKISHLLIPLRSQEMSLGGICNVLNTSGMKRERGTNFIHLWSHGWSKLLGSEESGVPIATVGNNYDTSIQYVKEHYFHYDVKRATD